MFLDAAATGDLATVETCLTDGVSVQLVNEEGLTALHLAATGKHINVVHALLAAGAYPNGRAPPPPPATPIATPRSRK